MALIEARAAGLPVVATDVGAVSDVLDGDPRSAVIASGDATALRAALDRVIADPGDASGPAPAALPDTFHAEAIVARLELLYAEVVAR